MAATTARVLDAADPPPRRDEARFAGDYKAFRAALRVERGRGARAPPSPEGAAARRRRCRCARRRRRDAEHEVHRDAPGALTPSTPRCRASPALADASLRSPPTALQPSRRWRQPSTLIALPRVTRRPASQLATAPFTATRRRLSTPSPSPLPPAASSPPTPLQPVAAVLSALDAALLGTRRASLHALPKPLRRC